MTVNCFCFVIKKCSLRVNALNFKLFLYFSGVFEEDYFANQTVRQDLNSLLRYLLHCFSQTGNYLYFADVIMLNFHMSFKTLCYHKALLSTDVLVKLVQTAVDSCCVIQNKLKSETKLGYAQELISAISQILIIVRAVILRIMKRSDIVNDTENSKEFKNDKNHRIAKILLEEVLNRCPTVSAPLHGYEYPVANLLFYTRFKPYFHANLTEHCATYYVPFMKMLVQSHCELNATDSLGNTILHNVLSDMLQEIDFFHDHIRYYSRVLVDAAVKMVELLLEKGAYPHAKNQQGKYALDLLVDYKTHSTFNVENMYIRCKDLMSKYDYTLTLRYMAATKIVHSKLPYGNLLPQALVKFVDMH